MSNGKCETCIHWGAKVGADVWDDWAAAEAGMKRCAGVSEHRHLEAKARKDRDQFADHEAYAAHLASTLAAAKAYVQDGSDYIADLVTGSDFGCVLHKATLDEPPEPA